MSRARTIELARQFRKEPTPCEERLSDRLRDRRLEGLKFRRQHPRQGCIADFYCAEKNLVVEVDGGVHLEPEQRDRDAARDAELKSRGALFLRFTNEEAERDLPGVLERIAAAAAER